MTDSAFRYPFTSWRRHFVHYDSLTLTRLFGRVNSSLVSSELNADIWMRIISSDIGDLRVWFLRFDGCESMWSMWVDVSRWNRCDRETPSSIVNIYGLKPLVSSNDWFSSTHTYTHKDTHTHIHEISVWLVPDWYLWTSRLVSLGISWTILDNLGQFSRLDTLCMFDWLLLT
jgi:hypothetical protein